MIQEMRRIGEDIDKLKAKITRKLHADNKWTGLLMSRRENYFNCLEIDETKMDHILENDHRHWLKNL